MPGIQQAVVLAREDNPGRQAAGRLCGCASWLYARSKRPTHLICCKSCPSTWCPRFSCLLESLPLTPNGKLDRKALPAPEPTGPELNQLCPAPRTPIEEILASIWAEVLKLDSVGIQDNFFDIGGHSLLATQVVSRVRNGCGVDLALRDVFEAPTIEALAQRVQSHKENKNANSAAPISRVVRSQYRVR